MSTARAVFKSTLWNHAGKVLEYILMYAESVLIARGLGLETNGVYAGVISFSQFLFVLSSFGLETSINKHLPQLGGHHRESRTRFLLRRLLLLRLLLISATAALLWGVLQLVDPGSLGAVRDYLGLLVLVAAVRSVVPLLAMTLTAQLRTALTAKVNLVIRSLEVAAIVFLLPRGLTIGLLLTVFALAGALQLLCFILFARENVIGEESPAEVRPVIIFGAIFWGNTLVDYFLGRQGDVLLLTTLLQDAAQASVYDVAYSVVQVAALSVTVGLTGVTFATFARLAVTSESDMNRFYGFMVRMVSLVTVPIYAFLVFNADAVVRLLYSADFAASAIPLQIMAGARLAARMFGGGENAEYLLSRGRVKALTLIGVFAAAINIGLDIAFIPVLGARGAAGASGIANLTANLLTAILIYRLSGNLVQASSWVRIATVAIVSAWLASSLIGGEALIGVVMRGVTFSGFCLVLAAAVKPVRQFDVEWLSRIDVRLAFILRPFSTKLPSVES
jgi:O-antigen/teichoic acid export membrane protein